MDRWLKAGLDYVSLWLEFQMRMSRQPGCIIAVAHRGQVVLEQAFGHADLATGARLTPRHRFRIASHSKSFTAAGIMKLREQRKLKLDDPIGDYVDGVHAAVARVTIGQILSHSAGIVRDGPDSGWFEGRRPYPKRDGLLADLQEPPIIEPNSRFKYSNHGFSLLGIAISSITGEPYAGWIKREIVDASGLEETTPDMPLKRGTPFARGHSGEVLLGRRVVVPGDYTLEALAPAGAFVSTARDVVRFFASLSPNARTSVLSRSSRREMTRRQWRNPNASIETYYGLGTQSGTLNGWEWFGHGGSLQGYISRTAVLPDKEIAVTVLTNALDGWAGPWVDGTIHILRAFADNGAPSRRLADWTSRWWSSWGATDLIALGNKVLATGPGFWNPIGEASELEITRRDAGTVKLANGFANHGEPVRRVRNKQGRVTEVWLGGVKLSTEGQVAATMQRRYKPARAR
jgi:CubicO group peptidase (beta-lactamase class C family)